MTSSGLSVKSALLNIVSKKPFLFCSASFTTFERAKRREGEIVGGRVRKKEGKKSVLHLLCVFSYVCDIFYRY